ncbi:hypothetical protein ACHAXR_009208 [Thalassiosira sp. AJA248-18]
MNSISPTFISPPSYGNNNVKPPCHHGWHIHQRILDQRCHGHHRFSVVLRLANDPFYGLTDDGDFAILGVNVDEETTSGDADTGDGQLIGSNLSSLMSETSFSGISGDILSKPTPPKPNIQPTDALMDSRTAGLADAMSLNDALFGRLPPNDMGTVTTNDTSNRIIGDFEGIAVGKKIGGTYPILNNEHDENLFLDIKDWLLSVIPKLNENDIESYTQGLSNIGFHPDCATMCELKYDDLDFMKVLHQRYIFNEVTGIEHPWEV